MIVYTESVENAAENAVKNAATRKKSRFSALCTQACANTAKSLQSLTLIKFRLIGTRRGLSLDKPRADGSRLVVKGKCPQTVRSQGVHRENHRIAIVAIPRNRKNPPVSVKVVTKIEEATAGSNPNRSRTSGTRPPATPAMTRLPHIAKRRMPASTH